MASDSESHAGHLAALAAAQRENASDLLAAVRAATADGMSWRQVGEAVGIPASTLFRQVKAGSPVVVVRPTQDPARVPPVPEALGATLGALGMGWLGAFAEQGFEDTAAVVRLAQDGEVPRDR